jgi:hypothetical protein
VISSLQHQHSPKLGAHHSPISTGYYFYHIQGVIFSKITHPISEGSSLLLANHFHIKRTGLWSTKHKAQTSIATGWDTRVSSHETSISSFFWDLPIIREAVVECRPHDWKVVGSIPGQVTIDFPTGRALCSCSWKPQIDFCGDWDIIIIPKVLWARFYAMEKCYTLSVSPTCNIQAKQACLLYTEWNVILMSIPAYDLPKGLFVM